MQLIMQKLFSDTKNCWRRKTVSGKEWNLRRKSWNRIKNILIDVENNVFEKYIQEKRLLCIII